MIIFSESIECFLFESTYIFYAFFFQATSNSIFRRTFHILMWHVAVVMSSSYSTCLPSPKCLLTTIDPQFISVQIRINKWLIIKFGFNSFQLVLLLIVTCVRALSYHDLQQYMLYLFGSHILNAPSPRGGAI